jgi:hypothetical protein
VISLALVFHVSSAVALLTLGWFLLRFRQDRDFLRRLVRVQSGQEKVRVVVAEPVVWLVHVAKSLGVECESRGSRRKSSLVRIDAQVVFTLLLSRIPERIVLESDHISIETGARWSNDELARLTEALGGLRVEIRPSGPSTV